MALAKARPLPPAEVHTTADILGGMPCVRGTRVPVMTIVAEINGGATREEIFHHYPSLPIDAVEAVERWARENGIELVAPAVDR